MPAPQQLHPLAVPSLQGIASAAPIAPVLARLADGLAQPSVGQLASFLYFLAVCWHYSDSQLQERLQMEARILRRREVERLTLLSKASIYRQMQMGTFPMPLKLGPRSVAWVAEEIP